MRYINGERKTAVPLFNITNKFLKEIMHAPQSDKNQLTLLWNLETSTFSTKNFHPKKVQHRITIQEIQQVSFHLCLFGSDSIGDKIFKADSEL